MNPWDCNAGLTFQKGLYGKKGAMRQSIRSTLSTATASSSSVRRAVSVVLLNKEELQVLVEPKGKVADVFSQVCDHLGLRETEYFGLAQLIEGEYHFTDLELKVSKLAPKTRRSHSQQNESQSVLTLHFRVQFYVDHVMLLRERVTRHQYYLQLRDNFVHAAQMVGAERCFLLAAYALQADLGAYNAHKHARAYFDPREYFPAWVISQHGPEYIVSSMPAMHSDLNGMTKMEAQMHFIKDVSASPAAHNLHFYRLKKRKIDRLGTAWIGICPKGVEIYEELEDGFKSLLSTFLWPNIRKLIFEKKKFEIRAVGTPAGRKFTYYTGSDERAKYLLSLCRTTHLFQMTVQPKLAEIRHLEAEDKKRFRDTHREAYIYSDKRELDRDHGRASGRSQVSYLSASATPPSDTRPPPSCSSVLDQRVSVISNTSSNTTSGIVSDKMCMSFDDSEDYYQCSDDMRSMEIMIDSPPSKIPSNFMSGSYTTPHPRVTPFQGIPGFKASGLSSSPASLNRVGELPRPMSSSSRTHSSGVSRTSSCHSQRSGKLVLSPMPPSATTTLAEVHALPRPADVHIQRISLAPTMTVSSTPVPPGVGAVFSGVVTGGVPPHHHQQQQVTYGSLPPVVTSATYVNVSELMGAGTGHYVQADVRPPQAPYMSDMSPYAGQTFVVESHPIQQVATPVLPPRGIQPPISGGSPLHSSGATSSMHMGNFQGTFGPTSQMTGGGLSVAGYSSSGSSGQQASQSMGAAAMSLDYHNPSDYPMKVLSVATNPPMVVTSHPHVPPGVAAQQCLPVEVCLPLAPPQTQTQTQPQPQPQNQPQPQPQPQHQPQPQPAHHLAQQAPPLTPHLTHAHLSPPTPDQAPPTGHHTPPTMHMTPPTLHKTTELLAPQTTHQLLQAHPVQPPSPHTAPVSIASVQDTAVTGPVGLNVPLETSTPNQQAKQQQQQEPVVMDHSVTVDDHTRGPSTPLTVLPPTTSASPTLTVLPPPTLVTPPEYTPPPATNDQEAPPANPPPVPLTATGGSPTNPAPAAPRQRGGLVPSGDAWGAYDVSPRGAGRSQQRHHSMGKYDQLLSPNAGRDSENRRRGRRSKTCPSHGMMPDVAAELQGLSGKNLSLPLLSALCNDSSLIMQVQETCNCSSNIVSPSTTSGRDEKSLSFCSSSNTLITNEAGSGCTTTRPVSWHSGTFNLDQTFKLFPESASPVIPGSRMSYLPPAKSNSPTASAAFGEPKAQMPVLAPPPVRSHSDELASLTSTQLQASPLIAGLLAPSLGRSALSVMGAATGSASKLNSGSASGAMFPSKLTSGGHSPNSSETLHQQANMGLA